MPSAHLAMAHSHPFTSSACRPPTVTTTREQHHHYRVVAHQVFGAFATPPFTSTWYIDTPFSIHNVTNNPTMSMSYSFFCFEITLVWCPRPQSYEFHIQHTFSSMMDAISSLYGVVIAPKPLAPTLQSSSTLRLPPLGKGTSAASCLTCVACILDCMYKLSSLRVSLLSFSSSSSRGQ
jgi:hypothetical protein